MLCRCKAYCIFNKKRVFTKNGETQISISKQTKTKNSRSKIKLKIKICSKCFLWELQLELLELEPWDSIHQDQEFPTYFIKRLITKLQKMTLIFYTPSPRPTQKLLFNPFLIMFPSFHLVSKFPSGYPISP